MRGPTKKNGSRGTGRGLTRREFMSRTTATGMALGLPGLLSGCGSDDDGALPPPTTTPTGVPTGTPTPQPPGPLRELHFDFSFFAGLRDLRLFALVSRLHQVLLSLHTPESRARARERIPALLDVADELLTHFIEELDLPADALQTLWVTGR